MRRSWNQYLRPTTIEQALDALQHAQGNAALLAGGTDLLIDLDQGRHPPVETLIDITEIEALRQIRQQGNHIFLGAAVTHNTIVRSPLLQEHAACLVEGCHVIGGPQVRNVATIGGNVAHALPAGDGTIALMALEAQALLATPEGRNWKPLPDLFAGPGETTYDRARTLLVGFRFSIRQSDEASAFQRVMRPQGIAIAILNMALWLAVEPQGVVRSARLAVGPGGPRPFRAARTERFLEGSQPTADLAAAAGEVLLEEIQLRTSAHRATKRYREGLASVLLERCLERVQGQLRANPVEAS